MIDEHWSRIQVIGVDDSGPAGLSGLKLALVADAELLCGGHRTLGLFPDSAAERLALEGGLESAFERLDSAAGHLRVVVLASGDPCFFGIGPLLVDRLGQDRVQIHPHASSVALAFSRLGMAWQDATVLSVHGRPIAGAIPAALAATKLAFLTDPEHTPALVASALLSAGMEDCPAYVLERLGGPAEAVHELHLAAVLECSFDPLNVFILLPRPSSFHRAAFGRPDSGYHVARGQITKAEVRAVTLARLEPWRTTTAWDVGAGAGSVAIEMASLMPRGSVYAIEHDEEQQGILQKNILEHGARNVRLIAAAAPEALGALPAPDAIFVGGGGSRLPDILRVCADRLLPGGRLVANFAQIENLSLWQTFSTNLGWPHDFAQIAVSRGVPVGQGTRLSACNPVFVTRLLRPENDQ